MANQYSFATMPQLHTQRNKFIRPSQLKTSWNMGEIIPIYMDEMYPGDTFSIDMAEVVRMSTPIRPIMDNIKMDIYAFFVPMRLVWDKTKDFFGENTQGYGPAPKITAPMYNLMDVMSGEISADSIGHYMYIPAQSYSDACKVSPLPLRGYIQIYNRFFRDQNVESPIPVDISSSGFATLDMSYEYDHKPLVAYKFSDYFTRALPYALKSDGPVAIPLGTSAPIKFEKAKATSDVKVSTDGSLIAGYSGGNDSAYVDLQQATGTNILDLRFAVQLNKYYELQALYGTRYAEYNQAFFGCTSPSDVLQEPEFINKVSLNINISQVLQTTGFADGDQSELGAPGANSVSTGKGSLCTYSSTEHGIFYILGVCRHDQTYSQGIPRWMTRENVEQYYNPIWAHLGAQAVKVKELYVEGDDEATGEQIFGYQESFAELRYSPSHVTGLLDPAAKNSLSFWTLANYFESAPTLGKRFLKQGRDNIARCLVTGYTGPDFIGDFYIKNTAVRVLPSHPIPGLMDHF